MIQYAFPIIVWWNFRTCIAIKEGLEEENKGKQAGNIAIINIGGGFSETSIIDLSINGLGLLAETGIALGGDYVTWKVFKGFLRDDSNTKQRIYLINNKADKERLFREAEYVKRSLCSRKNIEANICRHEGQCRQMTMNQTSLLEHSKYLSSHIKLAYYKALSKAEVKTESVEQLVLVGASVKLPGLKHKLRTIVNGQSDRIKVVSEKFVIHGAALQACQLMNRNCVEDLLVLEQLKHPLKLKTKGNKAEALANNGAILPQTVEKTYQAGVFGVPHPTFVFQEGYSEKASLNHEIGSLTLSGMSMAYDDVLVRAQIITNHNIQVSVKSKAFETKETQLISPLVPRWTSETVGKLSTKVNHLMLLNTKVNKQRQFCNSLEEKYFKISFKVIGHEPQAEDDPAGNLQSVKRLLDEANSLFTEHNEHSHIGSNCKRLLGQLTKAEEQYLKNILTQHG